MTFTRWLAEYQASVVSLAAVLISASALIVAIKAYRLNRHIAGRAGRLKQVSVTKVAAGTRRYSPGFKATNGPDEVTVTDVLLRIEYRIVQTNKASGKEFVRFLRPTSFQLLGIHGPALPIRLSRYDEAIWKLPSWRALNIPDEITIDDTLYNQGIYIQLEITASGTKTLSNRVGVGVHINSPFIGVDTRPEQNLEELLIDTRAIYLGGQLTIGLHNWLRQLIESAVIDL